jgi:hypothetical protein
VTVAEHLSDAYRYLKEAAQLAYGREEYDIEHPCRDALVSIAFAAIELGLDDGPWTHVDDLAD